MVHHRSMRWETLAKRIGRNIQKIRTEKGFTQEQAAERSHDLSLRHWQYLEAGKKNLTVNTLIALSKALDVDIKALLS
ncbi:MAG: helix-turn-helix transcriptional regulator [Deltaproteobacteria bacterium]|nr:helix-turn-helix transcriptional regulator [Deltaproteobacteria bacterium]